MLGLLLVLLLDEVSPENSRNHAVMTQPFDPSTPKQGRQVASKRVLANLIKVCAKAMDHSSLRRPTAAATMSAATKRMCLTRDQRAVLEAVYAMEKLPDADLRERLSSYLNL